jgi:hypothetical protein
MPWFIMVRDRRLHEVLRQTCRSGQTELRAGRHLWVTFLMDCPRCRLQVRVYYRNSFLTSGTFGLLPNSTLTESRTQSQGHTTLPASSAMVRKYAPERPDTDVSDRSLLRCRM